MRRFKLLVCLTMILTLCSKALAVENFDSCLSDIKVSEAGTSCLFAGSNSDCVKNYESIVKNKELDGDVDLPRPIRSSEQEATQDSFQLPSSVSQQVIRYGIPGGIYLSSYGTDIVLIARLGFLLGTGISYVGLAVLLYVPEALITKMCDNKSNVVELSKGIRIPGTSQNIPVCDRSLLRPQALTFLKIKADQRRSVLEAMKPDEAVAVCNYYAGTAAGFKHSFETKISQCSEPQLQTTEGTSSPVQMVSIAGKAHRIVNNAGSHEIWWETTNHNLRSYLFRPRNGGYYQPYHFMAKLFKREFRNEHTELAFTGIIRTDIVATDEPVPPTEEHLNVWLNRPKIYEACRLKEENSQ